MLERIGMAGATPRARDAALAAGCSMTDAGRLLFPRAPVEDAIDRAAKRFTVRGRDPRFDFEARSGAVVFRTGGAAASTPDPETRRYRPGAPADVHDVARPCDTPDNLQWITRPVVATDLEDPFELDVDTVYACAAGTRKHVATSCASGRRAIESPPMLDLPAGGEGAFARRPFRAAHATTAVSPLRFAPDSLDVACAAIDIGMPPHRLTGPQAGATAPAALAGALAQGCAESLASLRAVNFLKPGHPAAPGDRVFVSDPRTGAFSGGGAEQALPGAASGRMSAFYGVPGGVGAGMTDSKPPDNQAGFEKALTLALAALSGGGLVFESAGAPASPPGCSHEALVIDDELLSVVRRVARGVEVTDETLSVEVVAEAVAGPGHYLGARRTMELMETEFVYPRHADRASPDDWTEAGARDIRERAAERAREAPARHRPTCIDAAADRAIRERYPIRLDPVWTRKAAT